MDPKQPDQTRLDPPGGDQAVRKIEAEIAQTREELTRTIDEIEHRLSPRHLVDQAKDSLKDATFGRIEQMMDSASDTAADWAGRTRDTAETMVDRAKENPIPTALLGAGVGWLLYSAFSASGSEAEPWPADRHRAEDADDWSTSGVAGSAIPAAVALAGLGWMLRHLWSEPARQGAGFYPARDPKSPARDGKPVTERFASIAGAAQEHVREAAEGLRSVASDGVRGAADGVRGAAEGVRDAAGRARAEVGRYSGQIQSEFDRMLDQNPLAFGVAALAVGAAIGMSVPETDFENTYLGEARDALKARAQGATKEAVHQVQQKLKDSVSSVTQGH